MANESAVENISDLQTSLTCPGCGQELNLLMEHLQVGISPTRNVIEIVDAALVGATTDDEGNITALAVDVTKSEMGSRDRFYVGSRSGAGEIVHVHSYTCLAAFAENRSQDEEFQVNEVPVLTLLTTDPQAEGRSSE